MPRPQALALSVVDRIVIMRVDPKVRKIETLQDAPVAKALELIGPEMGGKRSIPFGSQVALVDFGYAFG